jgi:hypothetical protein
VDRTPTSIKTELLEELLKTVQKPEELLGPNGLLHQLKGALMERLLEAEMTSHLGYEPNEVKGRGTGNSRNGHSTKTVETESGPVQVRMPRDRNGSFEPQAVPKHRRRLEGFDDKVLALYARGMSTRDIQGHLRELYGTDVSADLISRVTDAVLDEVKSWQARPLDTVYPIVYLDALFVSVRDGGVVAKKAVYVALGMGLDGMREVLGFWIEPTEGARFWLSVLVRDLDGDGRITSGAELFGQSLLPQGGRQADGFAALAQLDSNADGRIDAADASFATLRLWIDADHDGVTDAGELVTLASQHVTALSLGYTRSDEKDLFGNSLRLQGSFERDAGGMCTQGSMIDAWFKLAR